MNLSTKEIIRFIFRGSLSIASYGLTIRFIFHSNELILSLITILIFFMVFHFFYIDIYKYNIKYFIWGIILSFIITGIILTPYTTFMRIANIEFHLAIGLLSYNLHDQTEGKIKFSGISYFLSSGYLFTMTLALLYSTIVVNFFSEFPMNCKELSEQSNKAITIITKPFKLSREKTQNFTNSTKTFFSSTFSDFSEDAKNIEISSSEDGNKLLDTITARKDNLITKTLQENEKLNNTICDYTIKLINEKLKSPTTQYPVIILIILLIYPFLRIIIGILSFINFGIFQFLHLFKVYKTKKESRNVERMS